MPHLYRPRRLRVTTNPIGPATQSILSQVDALLADTAAAQKVGFRKIARLLKSVPKHDRGIDYTERWVALYAVFRIKGPRAGSLMRQITEARNKGGQVEELAAFSQRMTMALGDRGLTNHGYTVLFENLDKGAVCTDLQQIFSILDRVGYKAFLNSGTLLGAVRDGDFIGHDDDVDLAVILPATQASDVLPAFRAFYDKLEQSGVVGLEPFYQSPTMIIKLTTQTGLMVDFFPAWFENGLTYIWPHTFGDLAQSDVVPLGTQSLKGHPFPAPNAPEKMLAVNYGPNWGVPDSGFMFQWKQAREKFAPVLRPYIRRRRLLKYLKKIRLSGLIEGGITKK